MEVDSSSDREDNNKKVVEEYESEVDSDEDVETQNLRKIYSDKKIKEYAEGIGKSTKYSGLGGRAVKEELKFLKLFLDQKFENWFNRKSRKDAKRIKEKQIGKQGTTRYVSTID
jgi:hypothetical protein